MQTRPLTLASLLLLSSVAFSEESPIQILLSVGAEGLNNDRATAAVAALSKAPVAELSNLFAALNQATDLSANYLRAAIDSIVERAIASKVPLPNSELRAFLVDTQNHPKARRLAYEILQKVASKETAELLPTFVNDPSSELRYDAVAQLIQSAEKQKLAGDKPAALAAFKNALNVARQDGQIAKIAWEIRDLGEEVDLPKHFGFLTHWKVIGPFHNDALAGFETAFPPETEWKPDAEYEGKTGRVKWQDLATGEEYGKVDLNPVLGELKEVTGYAHNDFNSPIEGPAEIRLGCKNGWKIWFNGKLLFGRDEYHRGARIDQYRLPVTLQKGANKLLVKVCQNADVKDWTREWEFQLRICDASGTAILAVNRPPTPKAEPKTAPAKSQKKDRKP